MPLGTHEKNPTVSVIVREDTLSIYDRFGAIQLASHPISLLPGKLVKASDHRRDKSATLNQMEEEVLELLNSSIEDQWHAYLKSIRERKPRYYRDQLTLLKQLIQSTSADVLEEAMLYCGIRELYSINDLKSAVEYMLQQESVEDEEYDSIQPLNNRHIVNLHIQRRHVSDYEFLGGGSHE